VYSSLLVSMMGGLNILFESSNPIRNLYFITIPSIFLICSINWAMLFGIDYLLKIKAAKIIVSKRILIPGYYLCGILFVLLFVGSIRQIFIGKGLIADVPENFPYRRIFSGIVLCTILLIIKYTFEVIEEKQKMVLENERLLREGLQARFETLRQQVNPHFLFNSLSTLKTLMRIDADKAEAYLIRLAEVFRYSLQTSSSEKVTLHEELTILEAYLFMLKERFGENLTIEIQIDKLLFDRFIPPFTLQILAENCVKHNIVSIEKPLLIRIFSTQHGQITVSNNLQPKFSVESSSKVGLANIDKRYQFLSGRHIEIVESQTSFDVVIPLLSE
jgi:two-component system, LytTR family, sensor kinase